MFQFSCGFAFFQFSSLNRTPKITRILTPCQANAPTLMPFSKGDKILIKNVDLKVTTLGSYNKSFWIKVGRRTASTGCWWSSEESTGVRAVATIRILMITLTLLS